MRRTRRFSRSATRSKTPAQTPTATSSATGITRSMRRSRPTRASRMRCVTGDHSRKFIGTLKKGRRKPPFFCVPISPWADTYRHCASNSRQVFETDAVFFPGEWSSGNGSRAAPEPKSSIGHRRTKKFRKPFLLPDSGAHIPRDRAESAFLRENDRNSGKSGSLARLTFFACGMDVSSPPVATNW